MFSLITTLLARSIFSHERASGSVTRRSVAAISSSDARWSQRPARPV